MTHGPKLLAALARHRCYACGIPVGVAARGLAICEPCAYREMELDQRLQPINVTITQTIQTNTSVPIGREIPIHDATA